MNNYNIRRDRPKISSEEIAQRKDFDSLLNNYLIMSRPFYKKTWFFGVTGIATVSLLFGGVYSFTNSEIENSETVTTAINSLTEIEINKSIVDASSQTKIAKVEAKEINVELEKKNEYDKNTTFLKSSKKKNELVTKSNQKTNDVIEIEKHLVDIKEEIEDKGEPDDDKINYKEELIVNVNPYLASQPRIAGKIGGFITQKDLNSVKGIYTEVDLEVISFELHIATQFGGKVYSTVGNKLSDEMLNVLSKINFNEELFFENIKGKTTSDIIIDLAPIKYTIVARY